MPLRPNPNWITVAILSVVSLFSSNQTTMAQSTAAGERYVGIEAGLAVSNSFEFGGLNTVGSFANTDTRKYDLGSVSLTYGARDLFQIGNTPITLEGEFSWYESADSVSNSFPGPPGPISVFYSGPIQTARLGVNFWATVAQQADWQMQAGLGFGAQYVEATLDDNFVTADGSATVGYGMLAFRATRPVGKRGNLVLGVRYYAGGDADLPMSQNGVGAPAGNMTIGTSGPELRIGYQFNM
jgi:hypothetical protein